MIRAPAIPDCRDDAPRRRHGDPRPSDPGWNGIDAVEVDRPTATGTKLRVYLIRRLSPEFLATLRAGRSLPPESVTVTGGRRVTSIRVTGVVVRPFAAGSTEDDYLEVSVEPVGDFSPYTLTLKPRYFPHQSPIGRDDADGGQPGPPDPV